MKTFTTQAEAARQARSATLVYLLQLTLYRDKFGTSSSTVLYLSDRTRSVIGQEWTSLVLDWGDLGDALGQLGPEGEIATFDVVLDNTKAIGGQVRFSDLIRHGSNTGAGTFDMAFADATLTVLFAGGTTGDSFDIFALTLEEVVAITPERVTLRLSGRELALEDVDDLYRISTEDFPFADPDVIGLPVPILLGELRNVPALGVVAGIVDKLGADITATSPATGGTLTLSDTKLVGLLPDVGTGQVDNEQITWSGRNVASSLLTGITRGANGTTAVAHNKGAAFFQVLSTYIFVLGENRGLHLTKAVPTVRVDGAVQSSGVTVNLNDTSLKAGRSFVSLTWTVKPKIAKQVNVTVTETIGVNDALGVSDNISASTVSSAETVQRATVTQPITTSGTTTVSMDSLPAGGTTTKVWWEVTLVWTVTSGGTEWGTATFSAPGVSQTTLFSAQNGTIFTDRRGTSTFFAGTSFGDPTVTLTPATVQNRPGISVIAHVVRTIPITKAGAASRSGTITKTGTVTLTGNSSADTVIGTVTADVQGLLDDAAGTVSGTPSLYLQLPADQTKMLMREFYGEKTASRYDATAWSTTRTSQSAAGYLWSTIFTGLPFSEFRKLAGMQGRADLYQEGGLWVYKYRSSAATSIYTFTSRTLIGEVQFGFTPRADLVTELTVHYDFDPSQGQWWGTLHRTASLTARFGSRRGQNIRALDLPWVRDTTTALALASYWLALWSKPLMTINLSTIWDALILEKGDTFTVTLSPLLDAFGSVLFVLRRKRYDLQRDLLHLEAVQDESSLLFQSDMVQAGLSQGV